MHANGRRKIRYRIKRHNILLTESWNNTGATLQDNKITDILSNVLTVKFISSLKYKDIKSASKTSRPVF